MNTLYLMERWDTRRDWLQMKGKFLKGLTWRDCN